MANHKSTQPEDAPQRVTLSISTKAELTYSVSPPADTIASIILPASLWPAFEAAGYPKVPAMALLTVLGAIAASRYHLIGRDTRGGKIRLRAILEKMAACQTPVHALELGIRAVRDADEGQQHVTITPKGLEAIS